MVTRWQPDRFLHGAGGAALAAVNADGSGETRLLEGPYTTSSLSPDWKRVAGLRDGSLLVDGQVVVRDAQAFAWAPDAARLAFSRAGAVFVVAVDGSGLVRVAARGALPVWSPGGDWIAYTTGATEDLDVHVVRADGTAAVNLTRGDRRTNLRPLWSPAGCSIAFVTSDGRRVQLELADLSGRRRVLPVAVSITNGEIAWFPDGKRLAVETGAGGVVALSTGSTASTATARSSTGTEKYDRRAVRWLLLTGVLLLLVAAACSGSGTAKDVSVDLRIGVWPDGKGTGKPLHRFRLRCNPLGGNLPHGDRACYLLVVTSQPFAPVPPDAVCAQVYGGPQVARVRGRVRGRSVDATFSRTDSCQIERWERVSFLFPVRT